MSLATPYKAQSIPGRHITYILGEDVAAPIAFYETKDWLNINRRH